MLESKAENVPFWEPPVPEDEALRQQVEHARDEHLLLDPRPPAETNALMLAGMQRTGPVFWLLVVGLGGMVLALLVTWFIQMNQGMGITGLNRSVMWGPYIANLVYFIGIGHAGTFISAALRLMR